MPTVGIREIAPQSFTIVHLVMTVRKSHIINSLIFTLDDFFSLCICIKSRA